MSLSISNPVQDVVLDAEDEVMKMLEGALGPMTALLDKKIKQKMSQHALMQIIKGVINLTLRTVDAATPENEKLVLAALEESGISGKKEKRAGKLSGYTLFTKQMHQDKKEEFKSRGLKGGDVTKEIGAMWKKLSDEEKQEYNDKAKKENDENPSSSRKSKKSSRKGSSKGDKESHKCCFVISKGERKGEMCGTTVRSDDPTFEGQWLCSKHATAEKKKSESNKNKKGSKKDKQKDEDEEKSSKKVKKQAKKDEEEEEEKSSKKVKKQAKKDEDEEEEKPIKKTKKVEKKVEEEEEKPIKKTKKVEKKVEEEDEEIEDLDEEVLDEEEKYQVLDDMCISWEEDTENCVVNGKMTKKSLEKLTGKKLSGEKYDVILSATKSSLIVKYEEDDEEEMKSIKMDKMNDDLKKVHTYISSLE